MRIAIVSDAWAPQVNGVATTLRHTRDALLALGHQALVLGPDSFRSLPVPGEAGMRLAIRPHRRMVRLLDRFAPEALHLATEGPLGWSARRYARQRGLRFTTAFHTRFPEYAQMRLGIPSAWTYAFLRRFHAAGERMLVPTGSIRQALLGHGFRSVEVWGRGVDAERFSPGPSWALAGLPRPVYLAVGRVTPEKNLPAFLALDLPGSKVVVGDGSQLAALRRQFPAVHFVGAVPHEDLARWYRAADVLVFASRTDTFGLVMLEAMACGTPVAALPVHGPLDVVAGTPGGVVDEDLSLACLRALELPRDKVRAHACRHGWLAASERFASLLVAAHDVNRVTDWRRHPVGTGATAKAEPAAPSR